MVRQNLHLLNIFQGLNELVQLVEILIEIGQVRHKYMADPNWLPYFTEVMRHVKNIRVVEACDVLMTLRIDLLEVKKQQVCTKDLSTSAEPNP